jgi:hypothetical protein
MSDYPNSGSLFPNDRREKDTHPNMTGSVDITCPHCEKASEHWQNAWTKEGKKGKWLSQSFKAKEAKKETNEDPFPDVEVDTSVPF